MHQPTQAARDAKRNAKRSAKLALLPKVGHSNPLTRMNNIESLLPEGDYDPCVEIAAKACGIEYRTSFDGSHKVYYAGEKQVLAAYSTSERRRIGLTEPKKGNGKPMFTNARMSEIAAYAH